MVGSEYKKLGNMGCFRNPIVVSGYILRNILYRIVELFSLIRGRRHGWPNHVKTSCTVCVIVFLWRVFSLIFFVSHGLGIRFNSLQLVSELGLKISRRAKDYKAHKMKTKEILVEGGVDCSLMVI